MKTGYVKDDLYVIYHLTHESDIKPEMHYRPITAKNRYILFYVIQGTAKVNNGTFTCKMNENQLMIVDAHNAFGYRFSENADFKCLYIEMHPYLFTNTSDDKDFLRPFEHISPFESVIDCNNADVSIIKALIESIVECNLIHLGKAHLMPRINSVISQLCIYYDKKYSSENIATDSIPVKIIEFINRNYLKNITYQTITDEFFVSKPVINEILHQFTGYSLREYIEFLRIKEADIMLQGGYELNKVAELCGFGTYSTFYRTYKRVYGVSPSEKQTNHTKKWPTTK
ncbi:MAG: helix-turn-helix domain-containing protein [Acutalibacteraceae bacterium]